MLSRAACACSGFGRTERFRRLATTTSRSMIPFLRSSSKFLSTTTTTTTRIPVHAWQHKNLPLLFSSSWRGGEGGLFLLQAQQRTFSSRGRRNNDRNKKNESSALANEKLIKVLMKKNPNATPNDLMVRLVIDEGHESPATVNVVSLADAIQTSVDRMTDLIGTSVDSDPPVIRVTQLSKLEYKKEQAQQKKQTSKSQKKAFRFRAGIDMNDLERKVKNLNQFLEKGLECDYSVFSKARLLRQNANAGMELVERIQELVSENGALKRPPQTSEQGNYIRVQLIPKKG